MKLDVNILRITIIGIIVFTNNYSSFGQHRCSFDTVAMINEIRATYQEINKNFDKYKVERQGNVDFEIGSAEYSTGDDSWAGKEIKKYFNDSELILLIENKRSGAYQVGETRNHEEYYFLNGQLFFYYEREVFITSVSAFRSYAKEWRVYFCNENPIRILTKEIDLGEYVESTPYDKYFEDGIKRISQIQNKYEEINSNEKLKKIKTKW